MTARKVTVDLLDTDETVLHSDLEFIGGTQTYYEEQRSVPASAGLKIPTRATGAGDLDRDRLLRFNLDGTPDYTARIEEPEVVVKGQKPSDEQVTVRARDWLAEFADTVIDPPLGVDSLPNADVIRGDWTHPDIDRTSWVTPTFLGNLWTADEDPFGTPMGPPLPPKDGAAVDAWPDPFTGWIGSAALDGNGSHPGGTSYFYWELGGLAAGPFLGVGTGDDYMQWAFDNVLVEGGVKAPEVQWTQAWAAGIDEITSGTHHLCFKLTNDPAYGTVYNPAALAFIAYQRLVSNFLVYQNIVARTADFVGGSDPLTGGGILCLNLPAQPPGFTLGKFYRLIFDRSQTATHLDGWTLGFTDTHDSNGNPWPVTDALTATVDDKHSEFFRQCHDRGFGEFGARPNARVLDAWRWGERGDFWTSPASPPEWTGDHYQSATATRRRSGG